MRASRLALATLLASLSTACLSTVTVTPDDEGCPGSQPSFGEDCGEVGLACTYGGAAGECGDASTTARCTAEGWQISAPRCSEPPPFTCPVTTPIHGASCDELGAECRYQAAGMCGEEWEVATCTEDGWSISYESTFCSIGCPEALPVDGSDCSDWGSVQGCVYFDSWSCGEVEIVAGCIEGLWQTEATEPCGACEALGDPASCSANPACQWLVPGCGDPALAMAGCFPIGDCVDEACPEDSSCQLVTVDPCWNSLCDACGMEIEVCQPDMGGA